jgi:hypothetical protein
MLQPMLLSNVTLLLTTLNIFKIKLSLFDFIESTIFNNPLHTLVTKEKSISKLNYNIQVDSVIKLYLIKFVDLMKNYLSFKFNYNYSQI